MSLVIFLGWPLAVKTIIGFYFSSPLIKFVIDTILATLLMDEINEICKFFDLNMIHAIYIVGAGLMQRD